MFKALRGVWCEFWCTAKIYSYVNTGLLNNIVVAEAVLRAYGFGGKQP